MVEETRTPTYCTVCGSRLTPDDQVESYDTYTGFPVKSSRLHCDNPTTETTRNFIFTSVRTIEHPSWALTEGVWNQY